MAAAITSPTAVTSSGGTTTTSVATPQAAPKATSASTIASLEAGLQATNGDPELWVIGGGEVFAETLPLASRMHLTWVDTAVAGADAFFPRFDPAQWTPVSREPHPADDRHAFPFEFVDYRRRP